MKSLNLKLRMSPVLTKISTTDPSWVSMREKKWSRLTWTGLREAFLSYIRDLWVKVSRWLSTSLSTLKTEILNDRLWTFFYKWRRPVKIISQDKIWAEVSSTFLRSQNSKLNLSLRWWETWRDRWWVYMSNLRWPVTINLNIKIWAEASSI